MKTGSRVPFGLQSLDQVIGNTRLKKLIATLIRIIRGNAQSQTEAVMRSMAFLVMGASRTGKTMLIRFLIRVLSCLRLDPRTLNPCDGTCETCRCHVDKNGDGGLFAIFRTPLGNRVLQFYTVDCTKLLTPKDLIDKLFEIHDHSRRDDIVVVHFDEVHRLVRRQMDEILLKDVEDYPYLWFFTTAEPQHLEPMFQNRLVKVSTELPQTAEMENWLISWCEAAGIPWDPEAVVKLVEKSNRIVGIAKLALDRATMDPTTGLTVELVDEWSPNIEQ